MTCNDDTQVTIYNCRIYAVVFIDAINVKIRDGQAASRPIYVIPGVTADGERDILGLRADEHGDGEGAKFWLRVLAEVKNRARTMCSWPSATASRACWTRSPRSGPGLSPRPASCTCCGTDSAAPAAAAGRPPPGR